MSEAVDRTEDLIRRHGLEVTDGDTEFVAEMLRRYREADERTRADIRAFHESDGPDMVKEAALRGEGGERA